jgi:hypothetical protein
MERTRAQIRRLKEMAGTPLLGRRREGLVFTGPNVIAGIRPGLVLVSTLSPA